MAEFWNTIDLRASKCPVGLKNRSSGFVINPVLTGVPSVESADPDPRESSLKNQGVRRMEDVGGLKGKAYIGNLSRLLRRQQADDLSNQVLSHFGPEVIGVELGCQEFPEGALG